MIQTYGPFDRKMRLRRAVATIQKTANNKSLRFRMAFETAEFWKTGRIKRNQLCRRARDGES